jgi:predicted transcriptional regulator
MSRLGRRYVVRLRDRGLLAKWMDFRDMSIRQLAKTTDVHPSMIGHLHSGYRSSCSAALAKRIEEALDCPRGTLFVPKVSPVADNKSRTGSAA